MSIFDAMESYDKIQADIDASIEVPEFVKDIQENPPFIQKTISIIEKVDEYGQHRGSRGLDFGFENLNKAFNGLNPGLTLVAGASNSGKSALLLSIMNGVSMKNQYQDDDHPKKAYCIYFSLDDSNNELMPRLIASEQGMAINHVLFPKTLADKPVLLDKRRKGFENLKERAKFFSMFDAENGQDIERIEETIDEIYQQLEIVYPNEYQMVIFIDNFHDIDYKNNGKIMEDNAKFDYISNRLNELAIKYDSPILCSAEFRKINSQKRPVSDDIKSSGKILYEAKGVILVHNEVGLQGENADIFWSLASNDPHISARKMPVLEMHVAKNKFGPFKGREFLNFFPEQAKFFEPSEDDARAYRSALKA